MFTTAQDAKTFLISQILAQSLREDVSLSDVEEKMLYFSETCWTLPDILEVSTAFDLEYDQVAYENKIVGLIRGFKQYAYQHSSVDLKAWDEAVRFLSMEDHYLLVMVDLATSSPTIKPLQPAEKNGNRFAKLILLSDAGFIACAAILMLFMWLK